MQDEIAHFSLSACLASIAYCTLKLTVVGETALQSFLYDVSTGQRQCVEQIAVGIVAAILNNIEQCVVQLSAYVPPRLRKLDGFFQRVRRFDGTSRWSEVAGIRLSVELAGGVFNAVGTAIAEPETIDFITDHPSQFPEAIRWQGSNLVIEKGPEGLFVSLPGPAIGSGRVVNIHSRVTPVRLGRD
jgi:hypothetical protein